MREIKFRAWDGTEFYTPIFAEGLVFRSFRDYEDFNYAEYDHIQQYTGLKDEREKDVYEEDVVYSGWTGKMFVVKWDSIGAQFLFHEVIDKDYSSGIDYYEFEDTCGSLGYEVIGNIYENPELLEQK